MKARVAIISRILAAGCGVLATAGCAILSAPKADPTRFYVLSTSAAVAVPPAGAPVVHVRPVEVASYLRSRPVIVRRGENEIEFRDYARWGESLEQGIGRVLREELLARGIAGTPSPAPRTEPAGLNTLLAVRVLACEGAADGTVLFRATWEFTKGGATPAGVGTGEYRATDLRWDGKSEASLVARLSEAVAGLAAEIAGKMPGR